jgi:hypothetical protein
MKRKSLLLTAVATLGLTAATMAQTVPNYVPTNGLVGWWPFNGNANDESGNGNNGTVNGATLTTDRFGNANKAYSFDGVNDYIEVSDNNSLDINGSITISVWINPTTLGSYRLVDKVSVNFGGAYGFDFSSSSLTPNNIDRLRYLNGGEQSLPFGLTTNQNFNIIVVYNQIDLKYYINGVLNNSIPKTGLANNNNNPLRFGANSLLNGNWFNGVLDDIGIWNRALSQQEISDLYLSCNNNLTISPSVNSLQTGGTANFTATTSDLNSTFTWQSDFGQGFVTLNNYGNYSGANSNSLIISNVQLANHNQPIRAISSNTNCTDTSNVATIQIADTCITNVTIYDTLLTTVTDTLIINTTLSLPAPNNENTILIYPNPASDHITIDNGNYTAMAGYTIKIENNAGQQVFQSVVNQPQFYIDLSTWSGNGLYFVHLIDPQNNTVTVRKIVLQ